MFNYVKGTIVPKESCHLNMTTRVWNQYFSCRIVAKRSEEGKIILKD